MRIMLLDDEIDCLEVLEDIIKDLVKDAEILAFNRVSEAMESAKLNPPDVAFLDIQMPTMSGIDVAKALKSINKDVNIIFQTGYSDYAYDAIGLRVSGYLMKPISAKEVKRELENLRNPVEPARKRVYIKTFGPFEIFIDGEPVTFSRSLSKEVLAYLVDCGGTMMSRKQIASVLFEDREYDRNSQSYLTKIIHELMQALEERGAGDIIIKQSGNYGVRIDSFECDAYNYSNGSPEAINSFYGEYMSQYSWAEMSLGKFYT